MMLWMEYYVYTLTDPRDNCVFYIGKGKGKRMENHFKELEKYIESIKKRDPNNNMKFTNSNKTGRMKRIRDAGLETKAEKLIENISEDAAHILEEHLIERIGRKILQNGPLFNIEPGGKWNYPNIVLTNYEKTAMETIEIKYPELLPILEKFPHSATESEIENRLIKNKENQNK